MRALKIGGELVVYQLKSLWLIFTPILLSLPFLAMGMDINIWIGILAYCLFMWDSILGLRPKWIEKIIDLSNVYFTHGIIAIGAVILAFIHKETSHLHGFAGTIGDMAMTGSIIITVLALLFLTSQIGRILPVLNKPIQWFQNLMHHFFITRELNLWIHILAPIIVMLIVIHVLLIPEWAQNTLFMILFLGYFSIFVILYAYYGIYKKINTTRYVIRQIQLLDDHSYEIVLTYKKGPKLNIKGGQFVFIHSKGALFNEYHPFSVLEVKGDKAKEIHLGIRVNGDYTKQLQHLSVGSTVKVRGYYGHFTKQNAKHPNSIVAIGGGIGITPCISLMQSLSSNTHGLLIWSVHSENDVVFINQLEQLKETHPHIMIIIHNSKKYGHLDRFKLNQYLSKANLTMMDTSFFVCGPDSMTKSMIHLLKDEGIANKDITTEGFIF